MKIVNTPASLNDQCNLMLAYYGSNDKTLILRTAMTKQHIETYGLILSPILANFQRIPSGLALVNAAID